MYSVTKKQVVAVSGLIMVLFVLGHMAGNFLVFLGPEALNSYAEKLHAIPELLWVARTVLLCTLAVHLITTVLLTLETRRARPQNYAVQAWKGDEMSWAKQTMIYTGLLIFCYIWLHLSDFTLPDKTGALTIIPGLEDHGELGLYGLVWNGFLVKWRAAVYIITMCLLGMHLSHGVQSFLQTLGVVREDYVHQLRLISVILGVLVALGFSSIPIFINLVGTPAL